MWFIGFYSNITETWRIVGAIQNDSDLTEIIEERLKEPTPSQPSGTGDKIYIRNDEGFYCMYTESGSCCVKQCDQCSKLQKSKQGTGAEDKVFNRTTKRQMKLKLFIQEKLNQLENRKMMLYMRKIVKGRHPAPVAHGNLIQKDNPYISQIVFAVRIKK